MNPDGTPFLHNHPFWYISFIVRGGYTEQVLVGDDLVVVDRRAPSITLRRPSTYHRITKVHKKCTTLFITWKSGSWNLIRHEGVPPPLTYIVPDSDGVYVRNINNVRVYSKFAGGVWHVGSENKQTAAESTALSVHQCTVWEVV